METRQLGTSGPVVSRIALGAMTFGQEADEAAASAILDRFVEAGGTLVDTSDNYGDGRSEQIIGRWLARRGGVRDNIVLASKGRFPVSGQGHAGLRRDYLRRALDASLRRLGVEHLDLYQAHGPDSSTPLDELVLFAGEAMASGRVTHVGLSNFTGWQTALLHDRCVGQGTRAPVSSQWQYSLLVREPEWELLPAARELGLGVMAWGPLAAGWLTGKYHGSATPPPDSRLGDDPGRGLEAWDRRGSDRTRHIVATLLDVAAQHAATPAQAALAWLLGRPGITTALVGARSPGQLSESLGACDVTLDPAAVRLLDEVSAPPTPDYPYRFIEEISESH